MRSVVDCVGDAVDPGNRTDNSQIIRACVRLENRKPGLTPQESVIGYSRPVRLPWTTPLPAACKAGSMCSARVSASFTGRDSPVCSEVFVPN